MGQDAYSLFITVKSLSCNACSSSPLQPPSTKVTGKAEMIVTSDRSARLTRHLYTGVRGTYLDGGELTGRKAPEEIA